MSQAAIENEVAEYIDRHAAERDEAGPRKVVRNGHAPERDLVTGVRPVRISPVSGRIRPSIILQ